MFVIVSRIFDVFVDISDIPCNLNVFFIFSKKAFTKVFLIITSDKTCSIRKLSIYGILFLQAYMSLVFLFVLYPGLIRFVVEYGSYYTFLLSRVAKTKCPSFCFNWYMMFLWVCKMAIIVLNSIVWVQLFITWFSFGEIIHMMIGLDSLKTNSLISHFAIYYSYDSCCSNRH